MLLMPTQSRQLAAKICLMTILKGKLHKGRPVYKWWFILYINNKLLDGTRFMPNSTYTNNLIFIRYTFNFYFIVVETETQRDKVAFLWCHYSDRGRLWTQAAWFLSPYSLPLGESTLCFGNLWPEVIYGQNSIYRSQV